MDVMYAPVTVRLDGYGVPLEPPCAAYVARWLALPQMQHWFEAARAETEVIADAEVSAWARGHC